MKKMMGTFLVVALVGCAGDNPEAEQEEQSGVTAPEPDSMQPTAADAGLPARELPESVDDDRLPAPGQCPEECGQDQVCAPMVGRCVPDCRKTGECPKPEMICDETNGLCRGEIVDSDGGPRPPVTDGGVHPPLTQCSTSEDCETDQVCAPNINSCVPDCRIGIECPQQRPICDEDTGLCTE